MTKLLEVARKVQDRVNPHGFVVMIDDITDSVLVVGGHLSFAITHHTIKDDIYLGQLDASIAGLKKFIATPIPPDWEPLRWGGTWKEAYRHL